MMINIAQPLFVKADSTDIYIDTGNGTHPYSSAFNSDEFLSRAYNQSYFNGNQYYLYLSFMTSYVNAGYPTGGALCIVWNEQETTFEDNILSIQCDSNDDSIVSFGDNGGALPNYDKNRIGSSYRWFTFDFSTFESNSNGGGLEMIYNNMFSTSGITYTYYEIRTNCPLITTSSGLDIDVSFTPDLSGNVSRSYTSNGLSYNSDKFIMEVTNNSDNAQFAMFIVPSGDDITIPALQWSTSDIYSGNPVFVYVKDEWIYDSLTIGDFSSSSFKPSVLHYIKENETKYYEIAWASMDIEPNTSYDVVVYAAESDSDYYVSLNTSLEYEEVYRSTFYMSNPASYNPDNDITDNYSWNSSIDHKDLFDITKAQQDQWGNFYVNNNNSVKGYLSFNSVSDIISSFMAFLKATFAYLPDGIQLTFYIGLTSLVVLAIIKKVCA